MASQLGIIVANLKLAWCSNLHFFKILYSEQGTQPSEMWLSLASCFVIVKSEALLSWLKLQGLKSKTGVTAEMLAGGGLGCGECGEEDECPESHFPELVS